MQLKLFALLKHGSNENWHENRIKAVSLVGSRCALYANVVSSSTAVLFCSAWLGDRGSDLFATLPAALE